MIPFVGFPAGKTGVTPVPNLFFTRLLVDLRDADEIKLLCLMFYYLNRQKGYPRYMTVAELEGEGTVLSALMQHDDDTAEALVERLHSTVERLVARRILLSVSVADESGETIYLLANTEQGREALRQVTAGDLVLERRGTVSEPHIETPRPNIFELYEQNIGLLQPLLSEALLEAERDYPAQWIEDAFRIAVENNARNWRYIEAILRRWEIEGRGPEGQDRPHHRGRSLRPK
ncbi:MAG: DnaD domain protein [Chloroflexi bacterium]|nr:DnaD domain protein [Chloroflexota bacterium]